LHEPAVADHVGGQNRGETALRAVFSHPERLLSVDGKRQIVCAPRPGVYRLRVPLGVNSTHEPRISKSSACCPIAVVAGRGEPVAGGACKVAAAGSSRESSGWPFLRAMRPIIASDSR